MLLLLPHLPKSWLAQQQQQQQLEGGSNMLIINVIIGVALESEVALECQPAHSINGQQSKRKTTYSTDVHRWAFNVASLWHSPCHIAATTAAGTANTTATATTTATSSASCICIPIRSRFGVSTKCQLSGFCHGLICRLPSAQHPVCRSVRPASSSYSALPRVALHLPLLHPLSPSSCAPTANPT